MQKPIKKMGKILWSSVAIYFAGVTLAAASPPCCDSASCCTKCDNKSGSCYQDEVTGSRIKRPYRKIGRTVDSADPVFVISRTDIDRSGARDVGQAIRKTAAFAR
jgi:outer membrane cobalamin receptor